MQCTVTDLYSRIFTACKVDRSIEICCPRFLLGVRNSKEKLKAVESPFEFDEPFP